ncbi:MAG: lipid-A-disaccharide synthase [Bacteroides sp.]|nr:lipid-A-disaccharide synthase [Bacteroides sp.]MCM1390622.1 lipid-A-disaccharide synthase [Bacteroides sp.]
MKYFVSAGEASGDIHAAQLIRAIVHRDKNAEVSFLGGDLMAHEAGHPPVIHYRDMAFMGFSEVIRHLPQVLSNLKRAKSAIASRKPDALILVDYPSFNLKLAEYAYSLGIPVFYYISPKVWAWKEHRVKAIRKYVTQVYCILPFETDFYARHKMKVQYVGNPSVEEVDHKLSGIISREEFLSRNNLPDRPIIALVPGSRRSEIKNNLMIMETAAQRFPEYQTVIAGAPGIDLSYYGYYVTPGTPIVTGMTFELMRYASAALVTSGTATLECALLNTPQVVCYRSNGSRITYKIMEKILKIKYVSLPNLIADRLIVPEMLMHNCNSKAVGRELHNILPGSPGHDNQLEGYHYMRQILGTSDAADTTARDIIARIAAR